MTRTRVTAAELERLAFDNRQPIDIEGDYAFVMVGSVEYVAQLEATS